MAYHFTQQQIEDMALPPPPPPPASMWNANAGMDGGRPYAEASVAKWNTPNGDGDLFYSKTGVNQEGRATASVGFLENRRAGTSEVAVSHNILSAGMEVGPGGAMGRAALVDGTVHLGPVDLNLGVTADTGVLVTNGGLEVKVVGVGGKVDRDGWQVCAGPCIGTNWPWKWF